MTDPAAVRKQKRDSFRRAYAANPEKYRAKARRAWEAAHPREVLPPGVQRCTGECATVKPLDAFDRNARVRNGHRAECRDCRRARRDADRGAVLAHYGTVCACPGCGVTENLEIDHLGGGGTEHRRRLGRRFSAAFYAWLIREGFPPGYQTLCGPCNRSKGTGPACRRHHVDQREGHPS